MAAPPVSPFFIPQSSRHTKPICIARCSACSSHSLEPSHVLKAMGITGDESYNALRVSMGRYTTEADIAAFEKALKKVLNW